MKVRHSESLVLIWRLAELEAGNLKSANIEPVHLMLGLCKSVDVDLTLLVQKDSPNRDEVLEELLREVRRLRTGLRTAGLDARVFRRALRAKCEYKLASPATPSRLRRTKESKQIFADAGHFAELASSPVYPVHLLYALTFFGDETRDRVLDEMGVELKRLQEVIKREVVLSRPDENRPSGFN